jgi:hypothetical protein
LSDLNQPDVLLHWELPMKTGVQQTRCSAESRALDSGSEIVARSAGIGECGVFAGVLSLCHWQVWFALKSMVNVGSRHLGQTQT